MKITFNGAARIVTGSCYLIETNKTKILVDCGLFQGQEEMIKLNFRKFPFNPKEISHILLTHSHMDHCGLIPKLVKEGFNGKIWCTKATKDLCNIMLLDGANVQEETAVSKEAALYNESDAKKSMKRFLPIDYGQVYEITSGIKARFRDAGHILGAAIIEIFISEGGKTKKLVFSGDIGQRDMPLIRTTEAIDEADCLFIESTYGDRLHPDKDQRSKKLAEAVLRAYKKKGKLFIPCFAVQRTQELIYRLRGLLAKGIIPEQDVFLDSPLAIKSTEIFKKYIDYFNEETKHVKNPFYFKGLKFVGGVAESKKLNSMTGPMIIIAGSGMCTAGRIIHHLRNGIYNPKNTVLFVGYQADGTLGKKIKEGAKNIELFGETIPVKSEILSIESFSGHADYKELLFWVSLFKKMPKKIFVVHGEEQSSLALKEKLDGLGLNAEVPKMGDTITI
jgi:metallo-beta-lactamase family protein